MNNNQHKQKASNTSAWSNLLIILLIAIIMVTASIGIFAWAKYTTAINGSATAQVAKWSFKLVDGITETSDVIDFAFTRTDGYEHVEEGKLAPGTFGEFQIGIDARGTETILEYTIDVALENKPTNLKLYSDSAKTQEISVTNNSFSITGFMSLEDTKDIKTVTVYWDWPYETGTGNELVGNDEIDTEDAGKNMTMQISVTGTEVLEETAGDELETLQRLADVVEVGDYVNYDASSNGVKTFTSSDCLTGSSISATISTADDFNSAAPAQWRVLSVDKGTGVVELIAADPTAQKVTLSGGDGFVNAETVLNNIGAIYGNGKGATGGRSIKLEDVEQYSSYNPYTYIDSDSSTGYYGGTRSYTSGNHYKEIKDEEENVIGYETSKTTANSSNPVTMTSTIYTCYDQSFWSNITIYNMIFKNIANTNNPKSNFWLASRGVELAPEFSCFAMQFVAGGSITMCHLCTSAGNDYSLPWGIVPVISLESSIQTMGQDESGVWQLKLD